MQRHHLELLVDSRFGYEPPRELERIDRPSRNKHRDEPWCRVEYSHVGKESLWEWREGSVFGEKVFEFGVSHVRAMLSEVVEDREVERELDLESVKGFKLRERWVLDVFDHGFWRDCGARQVEYLKRRAKRHLNELLFAVVSRFLHSARIVASLVKIKAQEQAREVQGTRVKLDGPGVVEKLHEVAFPDLEGGKLYKGRYGVGGQMGVLEPDGLEVGQPLAEAGGKKIRYFLVERLPGAI